MKKLNRENIYDFGKGCAILGSGGGGDVGLPCMMAEVQMEKCGTVSLINYSELKPDDVVMAIGFIGAPSAAFEKLPSGREFEFMFEYVKKSLNKKISVVMPYEIGGGNGVYSMVEAARFRLPILDADMMGRAFPEAQMTSYSMHGDPYLLPGFITDCLGNTTVIYASNVATLEKIGRQVSIAMGSTAAFGFFPLNVDQVKKCTIPKSVSKALSLGKAVREAQASGQDPIEAILSLCKGIKIGSGKIVDIDRAIQKGFLYGTVSIQDKKEIIELDFKNEFLIAKRNGKVIATTPDILTVLEQETGTAVDTQALEYGLKVHLIALPSPTIWTQPEGLQLVGPRSFGYELDYYPISNHKKLAAARSGELFTL